MGGTCWPAVQPTLLMSMVSRASCRRRSLRSRLLSEEEATPPLPVLPPGRCWKSMVRALGLYQTGRGTCRAKGEAVRAQDTAWQTGQAKTPFLSLLFPAYLPGD